MSFGSVRLWPGRYGLGLGPFLRKDCLGVSYWKIPLKNGLMVSESEIKEKHSLSYMKK